MNEVSKKQKMPSIKLMIRESSLKHYIKTRHNVERSYYEKTGLTKTRAQTSFSVDTKSFEFQKPFIL